MDKGKDEDLISGDDAEEIIDVREDDQDEMLESDMVEMTMEEFEEMLEAEGVEEEPEEEVEIADNSLTTLDKHNGAVFCIDTSKNYLASGGEDDKFYVYNLDEKGLPTSVHYESEKFKDSVTCIKFSQDGKFVAAADMSGSIRVLEVETNKIYWSHECEIDLEILAWHPQCNVLFSGSCNGCLTMYKFSTDEIKVMYNGDECSKVNCLKILSDGKRAACAYSNGSLIIWELKNSQIQHNFKKLQEGDLLCIDVSSDGNLIATGGVDMKLHFLNANTGKLIRSVDCKLPKVKKHDNDGEMESDDENNSIETVSFAKNIPLVVCATLTGDILTWDVTNYTLRNKLSSEFGFSKLIWNEINLNNFYVSSLSGSVFEYDCRNLQHIAKYEGHRAEVLDFCVNKQNVFTASNDNKIKVFARV